MRLYNAVNFALFGNALAQSFEATTDLTLNGFSSSSVGVDDSLTSDGVSLASIFASSETSTLVEPVQSTTFIPTSATATTATLAVSASSSTFTFDPSGTLQLVTDATDASLFTVASTATPTVPPSASASGGIDSDRVAVIALASILGSLVIGLAILIPVLIRRRKSRQAPPKRPSTHQDGTTNSPRTMRQRSASWLGSLRRSHPSEHPSTLPRQQYATAPSQPLMSEGSPIYGFHSPNEARPAPLFSSTSSGRRADAPTDATKTPQGENVIIPDEQLGGAASSVPAATTTTRKQLQDSTHIRHSSDHDAGNPYVDDNPKTPKLHQNRSDVDKGPVGIVKSDGDQSHYAPLASHPTAQASGRSQHNTLEVPTDNEDRQTERSSSIPRDGFANAIAGLGIDPEVSAEATGSEMSNVAEPATSAAERSRNDDSVSKIERHLSKNAPSSISGSESQFQASRGPRLKIPHSLIPGRQMSKKTRFSIAGNEEVSPTSESWLDGDDGKQGHYRRPSTISPVSPERNDRRARSEVLAHQRSNRRGGNREPAPGTMSAPAAASSQSTQPGSNLALGVDGRATLIPGVHHVQQGGQHQEQKASSPQLQKSSHTSPSKHSVKRKPVPLDLATLIRKPLPPHPIPTSKYNQTARSSTNAHTSQSSTQTALYAPKYDDDAVDPSSRPRGNQPSGVPLVAKSTSYDQVAHGISGMRDHRSQTHIDPLADKGKSRAPRPVSEVVDSGTTNLSYMQTSSYNAPAPIPAPLQVRQQDQAGVTTLNKRDTVQFFDDPGNREYAQVYGSYYAQPSPVQFVSPTTPQAPQFLYPPVASYGYQGPPQPQYYQPQLYQERPRYLQPPFQQQQQPSASQQRTYTGYQQTQPPVTSINTRLSRIQESSGGSTKPAATSYAWRDSQQDAWRDSLSRSGSDPISNSGSGNGAASMTGVATSNASSGGGGGPGLWGSPGFFGVDR